jgi:hypothetical protein
MATTPEQSIQLRHKDIVQVIDGQLVRGHEFALALAEIQRVAKLILRGGITDQQSCEEGMRLCKRVKDEMNAIIAAAEPERLRLQRLQEDLRTQVQEMCAEFWTPVDAIDKQTRDWNLAEQDKTAAEQKKANKGKRAENRIEVKANVPKIPGTRFVPHYRWKLLEFSKVDRTFLMCDTKKISKQARDDQDPEKTERKVGGIKVWRE